MIDLQRPDIRRFYSRIERLDGHWFLRSVLRLDGHRGGRRIAWYLEHGVFGAPLGGQVENRCGVRDCCKPAHQELVRYLSAEVKYPRRERDKKIRLLAGRGWKRRDIAGEVGCSMGIVRRTLKGA